MHNVDVQLEILDGNSYRNPEISEDAEVIINEITPLNSTEKSEYVDLDDVYIKQEDGSFAPILESFEESVLYLAAEQCGS